MGQNLTGKTVSSTYQDLVQISGSVFTDGLGNNITSVDISASYAATASFALNVPTVDTGSLVATASISDATTTYTKADGSTFALTTNNVNNAVSASFADQSGTSGFASQAGTSGFATTATSASLATRAQTLDIASAVTNDPYNVLIGTPGNGITVRGDAQLTYNPQTNILGGGATFAGTASYALTASFAENVPTVETGSLMLTGSVAGNTLTFEKADGSTFDLTVETGSIVPPFPYNGDAVISGSLEVTGSQTGLLADNEKYAIFTKQVSNSTSPNLFIGAQDPSMNGLNTPAGINNVVIGTGEFTSDVKGLGPNADNSNTIVGGWGGVIWNGNQNTILGGGQNVISYQGDAGIATQTQYNTILGGTGGLIERGSYQVVIGGINNAIYSGSETTPSHNVVIGGSANNMVGVDYATIIGGLANQNTNGDRSVIMGGSTNSINFATGTAANSGIFAGTNNTVTHQRSVVIGGQSLASTKNDEVVTPNLTISGSGALLTFADGTTQSTAIKFPYTGSAIISGSLGVTGSLSLNPNINIQVGSQPNTAASGWIQIGVNNASSNVFGATIGKDNSNGAAGNTNYIYGEDNTVNSSGERSMVLGFNNSHTGGNYSSILGWSNALSAGQGMVAVGYDHTVAANYAGALAGYQGNASHAYSATVGGANLATTEAYQVVVPNLLVTGSATIKDGAILTGSLSCNIVNYQFSSSGALQPFSVDMSLGNVFVLNCNVGSATDSLEITLDNVQPGQTATFKTVVGAPGNVNIYFTNVETGSSAVLFDDSAFILTAFDSSNYYFIAGKDY